MATQDLKSFHYLENGNVAFSEFDTIKSSKNLSSGIYKIYPTFIGNTVEMKIDVIDTREVHKHFIFTDKKKIDNILKTFTDINIKNKINSIGFIHKLGIIMYGKEGTGKSSIIAKYCNELVCKNAIIFYISKISFFEQSWDLITKIRNIQDNLIVVVLEEFDSLFNSQFGESELKNALDGSDSIDNVICFATTNYIDKIPDAIKNRPSRFKYVINIEGIQTIDEIVFILNNLIGDLHSENEITKLANNLIGHSIDEIKQFCLDYIMNIEHYIINKNRIGFKK